MKLAEDPFYKCFLMVTTKQTAKCVDAVTFSKTLWQNPVTKI